MHASLLLVTALVGCGPAPSGSPTAAPSGSPTAAPSGSPTAAAPSPPVVLVDGQVTATAAPATGPAPDIVLVVVDTLRADHLGTYGYARPTSPHLDAWAKDALVFERAYSHSGWTLASFASLLTGQLPYEHRVGRHPTNPDCFGRLPPEVDTLPERLQARGYATGAFVNNTFLAPEFGLNQGFEHWDWQGSSADAGRSADDTVAAALAWMAKQDRPVFVLVHMMEPHAPYTPPAELKGTFSAATQVPPEQALTESLFVSWQTYQSQPTVAQRARAIALYDEEILTVDRAFGHLLDGLRGRERQDRTLTVFTADHGEEFWEHGGFEHGQSLMGELTHVPLIVRGPGVKAGRVRTLVGHTDLSRALLHQGGFEVAGDDLLSIGALGPYAGPRRVISENTLYGPPRVSIVDDDLRLDVRQDVQRLSLWKVAPDASEVERVTSPDVDARMRPLQQALLRARGTLATVPQLAGAEDGCGAAIPSYDVFQQLETLGYLDDRPAAPIDRPASAPAQPAPAQPAGE